MGRRRPAPRMHQVRFASASAPNISIWTAALVSTLDVKAAQIGGSRVTFGITLRDTSFRLADMVAARRKADRLLSGGAGGVGGDDVGGVPV
jgi:hypothetical protein